MHLDNILAAHDTIKNVVMETPLMHSAHFSKLYNNRVFIKCENLQLTGAYKIRGALNKISRLTPQEQTRGVVCSSAGNHAQGVAYAAAQIGVDATIVMPVSTPLVKIQATKDWGAKVVLHGQVYDDAYKEARRIEQQQGQVFIHPFDDIDVIYGQGTIGLEILEQLIDVDVIVCPVGGGGLISGIALAAKALKPDIQIVGVQAEGAAAMERSFVRGAIIDIDRVSTIADGIAVKCPGRLTFDIIRKNVDDIVTVRESEIVGAFFSLLSRHKLLAEPAGVVTLAALDRLGVRNQKIACVISGGNIDVVTISSIINSALVSQGRLMCLAIELQDKPGELVKVASILADANANVIQLEHNQFKAKDKLHNVVLEVTAETNGLDHIAEIKAAFTEAGYPIRVLY